MKLRPEDLTRMQEVFALRYLRVTALLNAHRAAFPVTTDRPAPEAIELMGAWFERQAELERDQQREAMTLAYTSAELLLGIDVHDPAAVARVVATYEATGDVPAPTPENPS